jgi:hypothetical protein
LADVVVTSDTCGADIVTVPVGVGVGAGSGSSLPPPQAANAAAINTRQPHLANIFFMLPILYIIIL